MFHLIIFYKNKTANIATNNTNNLFQNKNIKYGDTELLLVEEIKNKFT